MKLFESILQASVSWWLGFFSANPFSSLPTVDNLFARMKRQGQVLGFPPTNANDVVCAAPVAQSVEQLTLNQRVQGSSPCGGTFLFLRLWAMPILVPRMHPLKHGESGVSATGRYCMFPSSMEGRACQRPGRHCMFPSSMEVGRVSDREAPQKPFGFCCGSHQAFRVSTAPPGRSLGCLRSQTTGLRPCPAS